MNAPNVAIPSSSGVTQTERSSAALRWRTSTDSGCTRSRTTRARIRNFPAVNDSADAATWASNASHASRASSGRLPASCAADDGVGLSDPARQEPLPHPRAPLLQGSSVPCSGVHRPLRHPQSHGDVRRRGANRDLASRSADRTDGPPPGIEPVGVEGRIPADPRLRISAAAASTSPMMRYWSATRIRERTTAPSSSDSPASNDSPAEGLQGPLARTSTSPSSTSQRIDEPIRITGRRTRRRGEFRT